MATAVVVGFALTLVLQIAEATKQQQRESDRRALAQLEATNVMERASALDWSELPESGELPMELGETVKKSLPQATLKVQVSSQAATPDMPASKKLHVELGWQDHHRQPVKPIQLVKWLYPRPQRSQP